MSRRSRGPGLALICILGVAAPGLAAEPPVDDCDRLAAHPADPNRVTAGIQWDVLKPRAAIAACEKAVERHPEALRFQYQLGRALLFAQRRDQGLPYLFAVAEAGYLIAFANIGGTYQFDLGNYAEALKWYRRGAELGDVSSQNHLADLYFYGHGVERNYAEAMKWLMPSARNGYAFAQYKIGQIYQRGDRFVPEDTDKAIEWYQWAASLGFARAQNDLGYLYETGDDVRRDLEHAARWYLKAARQGWALAQLNLARLYEHGRGVEKDTKEAFYWYRVAVNARGKDVTDRARKAIQRVGKRLDRTEVAEIDARIANWAPEPAAAAAGSPPPVTPPAAAETAAVDSAYAPQAAADSGYRPPPTDQTAATDTAVDSGYRPPQAETPKATNSAAAVASTQPAPAAVARLPEVDYGNFFALVIGNNDYGTLPKLETAVADAKAVADELTDGYGYQVRLLLNATRTDIVMALDEYRTRLTDRDNLLIYYAGHGVVDHSTERGYWLPVDASRTTQVNWVSNATVTDTLKALDAKHVLLVVDSCYSGTLTRDVKVGLQSPRYLQRMAEKRTRVVLASGGLEPVADSGGGDHSVFAKAFLQALRENDDVAMGAKIFVKLRERVMLGAPQTPEYSNIRFAGHEGGDFLFVRKSAAKAAAKRD